jgi:nicotinate phosphoribosyltransferase
LLEIVAPIAQAQLVEIFVMNQMHLETVLASKAARVVTAAQGRAVVDFGARRLHGTDAAVKAARAFYLAGVTATPNVLAGKIYGVPLTGTMAHSSIQACDDEMAAFRAFTRQYPETVLLVDTYDTPAGAEKVIALARELGNDFKVQAIRLDSGNLVDLARKARQA